MLALRKSALTQSPEAPKSSERPRMPTLSAHARRLPEPLQRPELHERPWSPSHGWSAPEPELSNPCLELTAGAPQPKPELRNPP
eukprot:2190538-Alexandrium_andersonii.AAC.1